MIENFLRCRYFALLLITLLGFMLRVNNLGSNSFWIDEIGVANVAQAATIQEALQMAHNHVMAMPLDYLIDWFFARFNTSEFYLRLPSVLWGTATLIVSYVLFTRLSDHKTALLTSFLLAISPIHIQYSQELRFYAALVFFYTLSTWLLIRAIDLPTRNNWLQFTLFTLIGIYFHFYTILTNFTGAALLWITYGRDRNYTRQRTYFIRSASILLVAFLVGLLLFGGVSNYDIPLTLNNESIFSVLGMGLGWVPFYSIISISPWIFGGLLLLFSFIGAVQNISQKPLGRISVLALNLICQILTIILFNALKHYFIAPRQFLIFLPFSLFYSVLGFKYLVETIHSKILKNYTLHIISFEMGFFFLLALVSLPALFNYYSGDKGKIRDISQNLAASWQPGTEILVIPNYEVANYFYYWKKLDIDQNVIEHTYGIEWDDLLQDPFENEIVYLVTSFPLSMDQIKLLESLSYVETYFPTTTSTYSRSIWRRGPVHGDQKTSLCSSHIGLWRIAYLYDPLDGCVFFDHSN